MAPWVLMLFMLHSVLAKENDTIIIFIAHR